MRNGGGHNQQESRNWSFFYPSTVNKVSKPKYIAEFANKGIIILDFFFLNTWTIDSSQNLRIICEHIVLRSLFLCI